MKNDNFFEDVKRKITAERLNHENQKIFEMMISKQKQKDYNDEMARKTNYYQQKFKFETNPRKGHEFWNVEADAFKHAFGSADMALNMGMRGSFWGGVEHERSTPNNPANEWNMDSWNNHQGREIAKEIKKEYGDNFYKFSKQKQDDIVASKVMYRMQQGQLITHPNDKRKYNGIGEMVGEWALTQYNKFKGKPTGYAVPIQDGNIFTPQEIGAMSPEEFSQNEAAIMQQMKYGLIQDQCVNYFGYTNPVTGSGHIYSRENIGMMSTDEYTQNEKAINAQLNTIGIPANVELESACQRGRGLIYVESYTRSDGTQVKGYYRSR